MCGRFTKRYTWQELYRLLTLTTPVPSTALAPSYNVAPAQFVPVVRQDDNGHRTVASLRWGLVPSWADDPAIGNRLINARSEDAASKPTFRDAFKRRRCLIPASDFYEWQTLPGEKRKQPWAIRVKDVPLFALAGLWESWRDPDMSGAPHAPLETFTILTGPPNELMAEIHPRMPVIVRPEHYDLWLNPRLDNTLDLAPVFRHFPAAEMEAWRVSTRVNAPRNDDPSLLQPVSPPPDRSSLDLPDDTLWA